MLTELDTLNPDYQYARGSYERFAKQAGALERGRGMTSTKLPARDFEKMVSNAQAYDATLPSGWEGTATLPEMRRGFATAMADQVEAARLSSNPFETIYGSPQQQSKVGTLFPEGAPSFRRQYELERDMSKTAYETLGGSPTAARQAADEQLTGSLATMAVDAGSQMMTGGGAPLGSVWKAARAALGDSAKLGIGRAAERRATQIAPTLFDTSDPAATAAMLDEITLTAMKLGQRKREAARYGAIYGTLAAPTLAPGW